MGARTRVGCTAAATHSRWSWIPCVSEGIASSLRASQRHDAPRVHAQRITGCATLPMPAPAQRVRLPCEPDVTGSHCVSEGIASSPLVEMFTSCALSRSSKTSILQAFAHCLSASRAPGAMPEHDWRSGGRHIRRWKSHLLDRLQAAAAVRAEPAWSKSDRPPVAGLLPVTPANSMP